MFDGLTERLSGVFERLGGRGVLSEKDIDEALREVRVALLEADVALPVVKDFISQGQGTGRRRSRHPFGQAGRPGGQDRL
jgi:signal recognition particle subunit SRP54